MSFTLPPEGSENCEDNKRSISPPIVPPDAVDIPINLDTAAVKYDSSDILYALKTENLVKLAVILCKIHDESLTKYYL